jgi:hypothetical protein
MKLQGEPAPGADRTNATYVYGVVRGKRPELARAPRGLPGTRALRAVDAGDGLWLLAADAPLTAYGGPVIDAGLQDLDWVSERAMRHEAVVEHFARQGTLVPMKLFTLFRSDERAVAHVKKMRRRLVRIADRVAGCAEWGMRVHMDPRALKRGAVRGAAQAPSGSAFLRRKKAEHEAVRNATGRVAGVARRLFKELSAHAREAHTRPIASESADKTLVLDAVFLLPTGTTKGFRAIAARAAKTVAPDGLAVTLTGPWPPYHFVGSRP